MDKNVGNVDIEELKRARQELDKELGIESDPNMYDNYNPDRNREESEGLESDESSSENQEKVDEESSPIGDETSLAENFQLETKTEENEDSHDVENDASEEQDFSVYDNFSAFEVEEKNDSNSQEQNDSLTQDSDDDKTAIDDEINDIEAELDSLIEGDSLEDDFDLLDEKLPEKEEDASAEIADAEEFKNDELEKEDKFSEDLSLLTDGSLDIEKDLSGEVEKNQEDETLTEAETEDHNLEEDDIEDDKTEEDVLPEIALEQDSEPAFETNELAGLEAHLVDDNFDVQVQNEKPSDDLSFDSDLDIIDNYKKLGRLEDLWNEEDSYDEEEVQEEPEEEIHYEQIEDFNFVDVISSDEFKNSDRLSYVLGKNEKGETVFGNLRDNYNVVIFGKQSDSLQDLVHSILLSLVVKNAINEVNFVMCDSKADSKFEIYNKSSYMYFNKLAKTNKEILDTLIEVTKELEERYNLLASVGVKSIEQYNTIAKNDNLKPLPYLLTVFNNYAKSTQLTDSDRINTCLYQILRYGRIAGLYLVLVSDSAIPYGEINYNLPTRLSFKADSVDASLETLGTAGAEKLQDNSDMLLSSVEKDDIMHLKVPTLSRAEVELLIENLEF